ncbi:MAG: hypothetical protein CMI01_12660 [Oceanospirillaceae bacterium]|nr:hypothetical protein [Oceanospirillaceae bacterium]
MQKKSQLSCEFELAYNQKTSKSDDIPMKQFYFALTLPVTLLILAGCQEKKADPDTLDGKTLYNTYCADCHHSDGGGSFLEGIPANRYTSMSEKELITLIRHGKAQMADMPNFTNLSQQQARSIAKYLREELK